MADGKSKASLKINTPNMKRGAHYNPMTGRKLQV